MARLKRWPGTDVAYLGKIISFIKIKVISEDVYYLVQIGKRHRATDFSFVAGAGDWSVWV
jgi:hypothetical protein